MGAASIQIVGLTIARRMSEYQYYEFQALDRPLTREEKAAIGRLSSRVQPTATRATFTYNYSDFPGDPKQVLADYFDIMYYMANWGTQQLMFRFPEELVSEEALAPYLVERCIELSFIGKWVILNWEFEREPGFDNWIEEGKLAELIELRGEILQQDYRGLYLAWLKAINLSSEYVNIDTGLLEPPVPPGLQQLSPAQKAFTEIFDLDENLLAIASASSPPPSALSEKTLQRALSRLSSSESLDFLARLLKDETNLSIKLKRRLSEFIAAPSTASSPRRTVQQLLEATEEREKEVSRLRKEEEKKRRIQSLEALAEKEPRVWEEVELLLQKTQASNYDSAVKLLVGLKELAEYQNRLPAFRDKIARTREKYSRRTGLLERLKRAGL